MNQEEVLRILRTHSQTIRQRFGVRWLALFGSTARGDAGVESDIDLLVEFQEPPGFDGYMALKFFLEELLEGKVDLVMSGALKSWARPTVEAEAIRVA